MTATFQVMYDEKDYLRAWRRNRTSMKLQAAPDIYNLKIHHSNIIRRIDGWTGPDIHPTFLNANDAKSRTKSESTAELSSGQKPMVSTQAKSVRDLCAFLHTRQKPLIEQIRRIDPNHHILTPFEDRPPPETEQISFLKTLAQGEGIGALAMKRLGSTDVLDMMPMNRRRSSIGRRNSMGRRYSSARGSVMMLEKTSTANDFGASCGTDSGFERRRSQMQTI